MAKSAMMISCRGIWLAIPCASKASCCGRTMAKANHSSMDHMMFYNGEVIHQVDEQLVWINLASGEVTHRIKGRPANSMPVTVGDRALIEFDGTHSLNQYTQVDLINKTILTDLWSPPHKQQTGYAHDQAKPFAEGQNVLPRG